MSVPSEEIQAIQRAGRFLELVAQKDKMPRLNPAIREEARRILRHYPGPTATELFWKREVK